MAITLAELRTEVFSPYSYLNDSGTQAARVDRWINQAYHELCDQAPWPFLEATSTGAAPLTPETSHIGCPSKLPTQTPTV